MTSKEVTKEKTRPKVTGILPTILLIPVLSKLSRNSPLPIPECVVRKKQPGHLLGAIPENFPRDVATHKERGKGRKTANLPGSDSTWDTAD